MDQVKVAVIGIGKLCTNHQLEGANPTPADSQPEQGHD